MSDLSINLAFAATVATCADMLAWLLFVWPGRVVESNPLVASLTREQAAGSRLLLVCALWALALAADRIGSRLAVYPVRLALAVAIVVGILGAASTVGAAL